MWFPFFFHIVGTSSFCVDETAGSTYLVCLFMQNLALLKMNKDHNQKVFIMQSIQKKSWMKSSNKVISWHCISKYNLGHLPLWCVHFSFFVWLPTIFKNGMLQIIVLGRLIWSTWPWFHLSSGRGWFFIIDLIVTWVSSAPLRSKSTAFDVSSLSFATSRMLPGALARGWIVLLKWEGLVGLREQSQDLVGDFQ